MVVWIPMVDDDELVAAEEASALFRDAAVPQFWDGARRAGKDVSRSLGDPEGVAWDIYLFYPPEAEWTEEGLPPPRAALVQIGFEGGGGGLIATKGALPPRGDQARLPARFHGRADIVGARRDLRALLTELALRHAAPSDAGLRSWQEGNTPSPGARRDQGSPD
jgi:hypothetical protein